MKLLNYYNEYSTYLASLDIDNPKYLTYKNLRFLEENINCYRLELEDILTLLLIKFNKIKIFKKIGVLIMQRCKIIYIIYLYILFMTQYLSL